MAAIRFGMNPFLPDPQRILFVCHCVDSWSNCIPSFLHESEHILPSHVTRTDSSISFLTFLIFGSNRSPHRPRVVELELELAEHETVPFFGLNTFPFGFMHLICLTEGDFPSGHFGVQIRFPSQLAVAPSTNLNRSSGLPQSVVFVDESSVFVTIQSTAPFLGIIFRP